MELLLHNKTEFFEADGKYQPYVVIHVPIKKDVILLKLSTEDYYSLRPYQGARIVVKPNGNYQRLVITQAGKMTGLLNTVYKTGRCTHFTYLNGDRTDLRRENIIPGKRDAGSKPNSPYRRRKQIQITGATPALISTCIRDDFNQSFAELVEHVADMKHAYVEDTRAYLEGLRRTGKLGYFDDCQFVRWEGR